MSLVRRVASFARTDSLGRSPPCARALSTRPQKVIRQFKAEHSDYVLDVAYDYYGRRLGSCCGRVPQRPVHTRARAATVSSDQTVKVWDQGDDGEWTVTYKSKAHGGPINKVAWAHPEFGQVLATCSSDRQVNIHEEQGGGLHGSLVRRADDLTRWGACLCVGRRSDYQRRREELDHPRALLRQPRRGQGHPIRAQAPRPAPGAHASSRCDLVAPRSGLSGGADAGVLLSGRRGAHLRGARHDQPLGVEPRGGV
jgi:hypothetical protein